MAEDNLNNIGLVLGNGLLPELLIDKCNKPLCALLGNTPQNIHLTKSFENFTITQVPEIIDFFKKNGVKKICLAGGVTKPKLGSSLFKLNNIPILWKLLNLPNKGDNFILSTILAYVESKGFEVVAPTDIIPNLLTKAGCLTERKPNTVQKQSINLACHFLDDISKYDIAQACVVENSCIIALEGLEGTAKMLLRTKELNKGDAILVKMPKKGQTLKIDMPTIGPETVQQCIDANLQGIVIKAESTVVLNQKEVTENANNADLFIISIP